MQHTIVEMSLGLEEFEELSLGPQPKKRPRAPDNLTLEPQIKKRQAVVVSETEIIIDFSKINFCGGPVCNTIDDVTQHSHMHERWSTSQSKSRQTYWFQNSNNKITVQNAFMCLDCAHIAGLIIVDLDVGNIWKRWNWFWEYYDKKIDFPYAQEPEGDVLTVQSHIKKRQVVSCSKDMIVLDFSEINFCAGPCGFSADVTLQQYADTQTPTCQNKHRTTYVFNNGNGKVKVINALICKQCFKSGMGQKIPELDIGLIYHFWMSFHDHREADIPYPYDLGPDEMPCASKALYDSRYMQWESTGVRPAHWIVDGGGKSYVLAYRLGELGCDEQYSLKNPVTMDGRIPARCRQTHRAPVEEPLWLAERVRNYPN